MSNTQTAAANRLHLGLPTPGAAAQPLDLARQIILAPSGLDDERIASVLGSVMGYSVDYADLYFQLSRDESWSLEDGIVKRFMQKHSQEDPIYAGLPVVPAHAQPKLRRVGRAVHPSAEEVERNPRSRSSIMRVAEKVAA